MRIGYPCINLSLSCRSSTTFRLASFSAERFRSTVSANLTCLSETLAWNLAAGVFFFRITSALIPFASHEANSLEWQSEFREELREIGSFVRNNRMRVSMHPDQFVVLNAKDEGIVDRSTAELLYHSDVLDLLDTGSEAKIQIHLGGAYGDKAASIRRFIERAEALPKKVLKRLVIENDERLFSLKDCLEVHEKTGLPVVLDTLHHACNNNGEPIEEAISRAGATWCRQDGPPIIDFSTQEKGRRMGTHARTIDLRTFRTFLSSIPYPHGRGPDIMLEIKDKERSAIKAQRLIMGLHRTGKTS